MAADTAIVRKPRRRGRWLVRVLFLLVVLLVVAVALAPTIASRIAPGMIEQSANASLSGSVKVERTSLGWFSPTTVGPVELRDPTGRPVARVSIDAPFTVWKVLAGRWWSARSIDLGEITLAGSVDIVREPDGSTNLDAALAPRNPAPKRSSSGGGGGGSGSPAAQQAGAPGPESIQAILKFDSLDLFVRERLPDKSVGKESGLRSLKGTANIDYAAGSNPGLLAKADLTATPITAGNPSASAPFTLALDVNARPAAGSAATGFVALLGDVDAKVKITGAPMNLADALGQMKGALAGAFGDAADIDLSAKGNLDALAADLAIRSPGVQATLALTLKDGRLTTAGDQPGRITLRSTEFLASLPATKEALDRAAQSVQLDGAPGLEILIDRMRIPVPKDALSGGKPLDPATLDLRGTSLGARVRVPALAGRVSLSPPPTPGAASTPSPADWKPFATEPVEFVLDIPDLSGPIRISAQSKATLGGQAAGELVVGAAASGILDSSGRVRALASPMTSLADSAMAELKVNGVATALLQPFAAASGLPIQISQDVGPTLDLSLIATTAGGKDGLSVPATSSGIAGEGSSLNQLPPVSINCTIASANLNAEGAFRLASGVVTTTGEGLVASINSSSPLATRVLSAGNPAAEPSSVIVGGQGQIALSIKNLSARLDDLTAGAAAAGKITALATLELRDVSTTLHLNPAAPAPAPLVVTRATLTATLAPSAAPITEFAAAMSHEGSPFNAAGKLTLTGLKQGVPASLSGLNALIAPGASGTIEITDLPRSALSLAPGLEAYAKPGVAATPTAEAIAGIVRAAIGKGATLTVDISPVPSAPPSASVGGALARLRLKTESSGTGADFTARLEPSTATLQGGVLFITLDPATFNPALASFSAPATPDAAPAGNPPEPIRLAAPAKVWITIPSPAIVPLDTGSGSIKPAWDRAGELNLKVALEGDLAVEGIPVGSEPPAANAPAGSPSMSITSGARIRKVSLEAKAPLSGLAPNPTPAAAASKRLTSTFAAELLAGDGTKVTDLTGEASAGMDASAPEALIRLAKVNLAAVEKILRKPGVATGALGDTAEIALKIAPEPGARAPGEVLSAEIQMTSPRVTGATIKALKDADRIWLREPATIVWKPDAAFVNDYLLGGATSAQPTAGTGAKTREDRIAERRKRRLEQQLASLIPGQAAPAPARPRPASPSGPPRLGEASPITITLSKFAMALPTSDPQGQPLTGPIKPGVFALDAGITSPSMTMLLGEVGAESDTLPTRAMTVEGISIKAVWRDSSGEKPSLRADATIDRVSGAGAAGTKKSTFSATISDLADARGVLTTDQAVVNADADFAGFPTPIIDQLANQNGLLIEALGPTLTLVATARDVSKAGSAGRIEARASSDRASADIKGDIRDGAFVQTGPVNAELVELRPELIDMLSGGIPLVSSVEKSRGDDPGVLTTEGLSVPIDGDLRKLNGTVSVDLGVARFATESVLGGILKSLGGRESGSVGRKIEPFVIRMTQGVLTYDRFKLPIGEFNLETRGTVDLIQRQINVVTYVPFFALSDEAAGRLNTGLAGKIGILDRNTLVPITTKGSMDNPKSELDLGLFVKETGENLLKTPENLIEGIGDMLGGKKKKEKDEEEKK